MTNFGRLVLAGIVLAIGIIAVAFYFGLDIGRSTTPTTTGTGTTTVTVATSSTTEATSTQWLTYTDATAGYSVSYPNDFAVSESQSVAPTSGWRMNNVDQAPGILSFTMTIPPSYEPQTNFVDAKLTIGYSQNDIAVKNCLVAKNGEATSTALTVNSSTFDAFTLQTAGAGQIYQTTSYRTTHAGACYAVEYTIHSSQLGNYASSTIQQFDQQKVDAVLQQVVSTFSFL